MFFIHFIKLFLYINIEKDIRDISTEELLTGLFQSYEKVTAYSYLLSHEKFFISLDNTIKFINMICSELATRKIRTNQIYEMWADMNIKPQDSTLGPQAVQALFIG